MSKNQNFALEYAAMSEPKQYISMIRELLAQRFGDKMPMACVHCYGCQQSVADGEKLKGLLADMGYGFTDSPDQADLVLYNTCAVRENAEQRVFGNVGALKHHKARRPEMIIGISGCMTQQPEVAQKLRKSYPHVDIVVGTNAFTKLPGLIYEKLHDNKRFIHGSDDPQNIEIVEGIPTLRNGTIKAWVPVMYGCDNYCSYCIVPYVRGRERSRESSAIVAEIEELVTQGFREITLLGQNVNSYGKGLAEELNFSGLLQRINDIPGNFIVRFMTSHPKDCTRELIDTIANCPKIAKQLHLPVQSGSNAILEAMNRRYTVEHYLELIDYARQQIPNITITSDIIVGFPGESREDFEKTLELVRRVGYCSLFTFIYSKRSGTRAETLTDPVPAEEKSRWFRELLEVQQQVGQRIMDSYLGTRVRVLAEGPGHSEGMLTSRSTGNIIVEFPGDISLSGSFVDIQITKAMNWALVGERVQ